MDEDAVSIEAHTGLSTRIGQFIGLKGVSISTGKQGVRGILIITKSSSTLMDQWNFSGLLCISLLSTAICCF